jgi:hypothetical protein
MGYRAGEKIYMEIKVSTQTYLYWLAKFQSIQTLIDQNIVNKSKVCVGESVCKPNSTTTLQRSDIMQILVVINAVIVFYNKNVKTKKVLYHGYDSSQGLKRVLCLSLQVKS